MRMYRSVLFYSVLSLCSSSDRSSRHYYLRDHQCQDLYLHVHMCLSRSKEMDTGIETEMDSYLKEEVQYSIT